MDGDQLTQIISEYIKQNSGFIVMVIFLISISLVIIIAGIVLSIINKNKEKQIVKETVSNANLETNSVNKEGDNNNGQN